MGHSEKIEAMDTGLKSVTSVATDFQQVLLHSRVSLVVHVRIHPSISDLRITDLRSSNRRSELRILTLVYF